MPRAAAFKVRAADNKTTWTLARNDTPIQSPSQEDKMSGGSNMQANGYNHYFDQRHTQEQPLPRYESYDGSMYSRTSGRLSSVAGGYRPPESVNNYDGFDFNMPLDPHAHAHAHDRESRRISVNTNTRVRAHNQDAVSQHLLYETALLDSQAFEILDITEVDALKKEHVRLNSRIEAAQRKLALESKVRDAAQNLQRLYSTRNRPDTPQDFERKGNRNSLLGTRPRSASRTSLNAEPAQQADEELVASVKKVDELHAQVKELLDRRQYVERKLLRHTAAVLAEEANKQVESAIPGLVNGRHGSGYDSDDEDVYTPNEFDGIRDILRGKPSAASNQKIQQHEQQLASMHLRLEQLNSQLRTVISEAAHTLGRQPLPEPALEQSGDPAAQIEDRFARLENSLNELEQQQQDIQAHHSQKQESAEQQQRDIESHYSLIHGSHDQQIVSVQERLEQLNDHVRSAVSEAEQILGRKPAAELPLDHGDDFSARLENRFVRLEDSLQAFEQQHHDLKLHCSRVQDSDDQTRTAVEEQLEHLNQQLRALSAETAQTLGKQLSPEEVPLDQSQDSTTRLENRFERLGETFQALDEQQSNIRQQYVQLQNNEHQIRDTIEEQLENLNSQLHNALLIASEAQPVPGLEKPPQQSGQGYQSQLEYMEEGLMTMEQLVQQHNQSGASSAEASRRLDEYDTTMMGLWDILQSDAASPPKAKDFNDDEDSAPPTPKTPFIESFSLQAFSSRVQNLFDRAQSAKDQQDILKRQIQQQRELNGKSDAEKDRQITDLTEKHGNLELEHGAIQQELANLMVKHEHAENEANQSRDEMAKVMEELEEMKRTMDVKQGEREEVAAKLHEQIEQLEARMQTQAEEQDKEHADAQKEMEDLEAEVVRLTTELTMTKAELDSAYGSRAERKGAQAAEVESLTERNTAMSEHVSQLETELQEMTSEFQDLTKESIELEKEREQLDAVIDDLRDRCENLEVMLNEEKLLHAGLASPPATNGVPRNGARENTSMMVLRQEFKKMMREQRMEGVKTLRAEQDQRRRLEAELRKHRQANGPLGKTLTTASGTATPVSAT